MDSSFTLAVATIVRGKDDAETALEDQTIANLALLGIPICVASVRSPVIRNERLFTDQGRGDLQVIHLADRHANLGAQLRTSLLRASTLGSSVMYLAGDKMELAATLGNHLDEVKVMTSGGPTFVNFSRTPSAFMSFPDCQRRSEQALNLAISALTAANRIDYAYSVYVIPSLIVRTLVSAPPYTGLQPLGWLIGQAARSGHPTVEITGEFRCPAQQQSEKDEVFRRYRFNQLLQFLEGVAEGFTGDV